MSAHIPEFRRISQGRTWDREWQPYAGTFYPRQRRVMRTIRDVLLASLIGASLALLVAEWAEQDAPAAEPVLIDMRSTT